MMTKPGITDLARCVDSRYTLVSMAAKRARMVGYEQNNAEVYDEKAKKPVSIAVEEIAKGRVGYVRSDDIRRAKEFENEKLAAIMSLNEDSADEEEEEVVFEEGEIEE